MTAERAILIQHDGERRPEMIRKFVAATTLFMVLGIGTAAAQESPPASVLPTVIEKQPTEVLGEVVLPKTGSDIDAGVYLGAGLTAAGLALAVTARKRRQRFAPIAP
jgi:LPXTG-motif cell wall-anchored protein